MIQAVQQHWRTYLIEAWALGMFMISAVFFTNLLENKNFLIDTPIALAWLRRLLMGIAMGSTAILIIYSPWGKRSGAHMNPAVTLSNLLLNRIKWEDAVWYIIAQFMGGALGVLLFSWFVTTYGAIPEVNYAATVPPPNGLILAFVLELLMSFLLFYLVLSLSNHVKLAPFTGFFVGAIIVVYITLEAPYSGMSMNPARTFASAFSGQIWTAWYIYFIAPVLGMGLAASLYRWDYRRRHGGNCLTLNCHLSGQRHQNPVYAVTGPKIILEKFGTDPASLINLKP